jgi:hypothetical protein
LPDIEELSTTLEPGREPRRRGEMETALPPTQGEVRRGFFQGFGLVAMIIAALALLYIFAGTIANAVPFLTDSLRGYVAMVDMRCEISRPAHCAAFWGASDQTR